MKYSLILLGAAAAVTASPFPQGVTSAIAPKGSAPSGCMPSYKGTFGIVVMNITSSAAGSQPVSSISDGQPQATTKASSAPVSQITDGQPQASTGKPQATTAKVSAPAVTQISDGQIQATTMMMTMPAVTQINDGQIQATYSKPASAVSQLSDGQPQAPKTTMVTKTSAAPVSQISDGQPQASTGKATSAKSSAAPVSQISDGQPQASTAKASSAVGQLSDGQPQATKTGAKVAMVTQMVACAGPSTLNLTLNNGILLDSQGRTGYIASNYQFQFDKPAQAGAIYTAGWSICGNGSLALGAQTTFYQCLSGNFYNLYNENWAPQCVPVTIDLLTLQNCS